MMALFWFVVGVGVGGFMTGPHQLLLVFRYRARLREASVRNLRLATEASKHRAEVERLRALVQPEHGEPGPWRPLL